MSRSLLRRLTTDERGQADLVAAIIAQFPFWFLITMIVVVALVGVKQAGTASASHLAARMAGTANHPAAGQQVAQDRGAVWGLPGESAQVHFDPSRRAAVVQWDHTWQGHQLAARLLPPFRIQTRSHSRWEGFYDGPPTTWE